MSKRQLLLLRHAKSSWDDPRSPDEDRPLSKRGTAAAMAIGRVMAADGLLPDLVLCSPARRASDTWALIAEQLPNPPVVKVLKDLYDFGDGSRLLDCIRSHGATSASLMLVGHNPSIGNLGRNLAGSGDRALRDRLEAKYPTGALAVFNIRGNWRDLAEGAGELIRFIRPKDVRGEAGR